MNADAIRAIIDAIDECMRLKVRLDPHASAQTRLLLDMLLLNLGKQLAALLTGLKH